MFPEDVLNGIKDLPALKKPFTDRSLRGGILNNDTRSLGMDQLIYRAYDQYPNPTMQFNSIIKYLIGQTSVISSVPKAFAALFQGIWTGSGSQADYEMIVQYKQQHRDDYRAAEKIRVQNKNYISEVKQPGLRYKTHTQSGDMPIISLQQHSDRYTVTYADPCVKAYNELINSTPARLAAFETAFYNSLGVQLRTVPAAGYPAVPGPGGPAFVDADYIKANPATLNTHITGPMVQTAYLAGIRALGIPNAQQTSHVQMYGNPKYLHKPQIPFKFGVFDVQVEQDIPLSANLGFQQVQPVVGVF